VQAREFRGHFTLSGELGYLEIAGGATLSPMSRVWIPETERKPLPTSGQLVGRLAEFFRLKGALKEMPEANERTARRYFAGEWIEPEKRDAILRQLVNALEPRALVDDLLTAGLSEDWLFAFVRMLTEQWDAMVAELRTSSFPITDLTDAPLPFLRMLVFDVGLRAAAWRVLREKAGRPTSEEMDLLVHNALKVAMDACIGRCEPRPTLDEIRTDTRVSKNTLDAWRAGSQIPHDDNLRQIAAFLAARGAGEEARVLAELRLGAAITAGWHTLAESLSDRNWVVDYVDAFKRVVQHATRYFRFLPLPVDLDGAMREVVVMGARAPAGPVVCEHLASLAPLKQEVQADLIALPGDWTGRINEHLRSLGTIPIAVRKAPYMRGRSEKQIGELIKMTTITCLAIGHWDAKPEDFPHQFLVKGPPEVSAMNRLNQANTWWSAGRRDEALVHLRRAIELDPKNASLHYELGCYLGVRLREEKRLDLLSEAVTELRLADGLGTDDPEMKRLALTEIGIVQSNAGRLDEALASLESCEAHAADWSHYWNVRGSVLMWKERYQEAETCYRRSLELQKDNPLTLARLAAVCWKLGRVREAKDLARRVQLLGDGNPEGHFEAILTSWPRV